VAPPASSHPHDTLSLGPAARLLGVDPDTLRRWSDTGRIAAWTTPGGHRRFDRRAIEAVRAARGPRPMHLASLGATPERLSRAYRRSYGPRGRSSGQPGDVPAGDREAYREDGRRLVEALVAHLEADRADAVARAATEAAAAALVDDVARRLASGGTSLTEAVGRFVVARGPFLTEIAAIGRRRALDPSRLATLYEDASALLDRLLLRLVSTYQEGAP
jgi:excisionase family DNA binding protein